MMEVRDVLKILERMYPLSKAGSWDNVGLLVGDPMDKVNRVFITNDLTEDVEKELQKDDFLLSYHPPMFRPFKSLLWTDWKSRLMTKCIRKNVSVYSPHSAMDAAFGGINDSICAAFDIDFSKYGFAISKQSRIDTETDKQYWFVKDNLEAADYQSSSSIWSSFLILNSLWITANTNETLSIDKSISVHMAGDGEGRLFTIKNPKTLNECVEMLKKHLGLRNLRVGRALGQTMDSEISTIAVCVGAGGSLLADLIKNVKPNGNQRDKIDGTWDNERVNLFITGELAHHTALDAVHAGINVILCEHSNTERYYLQKVLPIALRQALPSNVDVAFSSLDRDPLEIV